MMNDVFATALAHYRWDLSLLAFALILGITFVLRKALLLSVTFREAARLNEDTYRRKMERDSYAANQRWNRKWGLIFWVVIFGLILPFCITADAQPWWQIPLDVFVILMVYDFFYYLVHRFLFHDGGFLGGPLIWVHAVHHRQHNPCRGDSSFIHPIEVAMGLGLYALCTLALSLLLGPFHVATIVVTWIAFSEINQHNHDLWTVDRFPFRYLNTMSVMHHHHHARFNGGNFATISLLYDWLFGTLDHGRRAKAPAEDKPMPGSQPAA